MAKTQEPIITVRTVFNGKRTCRQAFLDLILEKSKNAVDNTAATRYNESNPNHGVHGGLEDHHGN